MSGEEGLQGGGQDGEDDGENFAAGVAIVENELAAVPDAQAIAEEHDGEDAAQSGAHGEAFLAGRFVGSFQRLVVLLQG